MAVSPHHSHDEPDEAAACYWASNKIGEFAPNISMSGTMDHLSDCHDDAANVDDESPFEPVGEVVGYVLGVHNSNTGGCSCIAMVPGETLTCIWVLLPVCPEEVCQYTVDNDVADASAAGLGWVLCVLEVVH